MTDRIFGLDFMRCVAILLVITSHTLPILFQTEWAITTSIYFAVLGVESFFVLSGFLIGSILIRMHCQKKVTSFGDVRMFLIRRWFRTLPNYFLVLLISIALIFLLEQPWPFNNIRFFSYLFFLQNSVTLETNAFFGVSWSLCIEEWFYFLFPFTLVLSQRFFEGKKTSFLWTTITFLALPLVLRLILAVETSIPWDAGFRKLTFIRLDAIATGVLMAYLYNHFKDFLNKHSLLFALSGCTSLVFLMSIFYGKFILIYNMNGVETADTGLFLKTIFFTLISFSIAALIPMLMNVLENPKNYFVKFITTISLISYALYLLHPLVMMMVFTMMQGKIIPQNNGLIFSLIWIISIGVSYLLYYHFEKRMTALRERF